MKKTYQTHLTFLTPVTLTVEKTYIPLRPALGLCIRLYGRIMSWGGWYRHWEL